MTFTLKHNEKYTLEVNIESDNNKKPGIADLSVGFFDKENIKVLDKVYFGNEFSPGVELNSYENSILSDGRSDFFNTSVIIEPHEITGNVNKMIVAVSLCSDDYRFSNLSCFDIVIKDNANVIIHKVNLKKHIRYSNHKSAVIASMVRVDDGWEFKSTLKGFSNQKVDNVMSEFSNED